VQIAPSDSNGPHDDFRSDTETFINFKIFISVGSPTIHNAKTITFPQPSASHLNAGTGKQLALAHLIGT
jgi:hypothetical protein